MTEFSASIFAAPTPFDDTIIGTNGHDSIDALAGDDIVQGRVGNDTLRGGPGDDVLIGGSGHDLLIGDTGNDTMWGGAGNDTMVWNNGDGTDVMEGGAGYDTAVANGSNTNGDEFTIAPNGARVDFDRINFGQFSLDIGTTEELVVNGLGGNDTITGSEGLDGLIKLKLYGGDGNDWITGGDGDDLLAGGKHNDVLVGFRGDDTMWGGAGDDKMVWNNGDGSDVMEGGAGYDTAVANGSDTNGDEFTIAPNGARVDFDRVNFGQFSLDIGTTEELVVNGGGGDDTITGSEGLDGLIKLKLYGGDGNDWITGGDGDDLLAGGKHNDVLVGFRGDDTMLGGAGDDKMVWNNGDGSDVMEGGAGYDTAVANGSDAAGDEFTIRGVGDRVDFDRVNFGQFSLDIGTTEVLEVNAQGGNDTITGGKGLDGLIKLDLDGGAGWDVIAGGDGDDWLTGGAGKDTFVFGRGKDTVTDFQDGWDKIKFEGFDWIEDFGDIAGRIHNAGANVVIDLGADELTLENVEPWQLDAGDFLF